MNIKITYVLHEVVGAHMMVSLQIYLLPQILFFKMTSARLKELIRDYTPKFGYGASWQD